jgi:hypothetical protein
MNLPYLLQTAQQLRQPPPAAAAEFESVREILAEELSRQMAARLDLEKMIGPGNLPMMKDNSRNFCRFMGAMFLAYEPEVLAQTALWVFRAYRAHGFHTTYWPAHLDTFVEIARARLTPETFAATYPFFQWLIVNIPTFVKISDEQLAEPLLPAPSHEPAKIHP